MDAFFNQLQIEKDEFLFQFQSHPNYPSLLAFSDTLNFLGFRNDAYELEREYWNELPDEFIAIYKGDFVLVRKQSSNYYIYCGDVKIVSEGDLLENSDDFVLLLEKEEVMKKNSHVNFRRSLFIILFLYISYSFYFLSWPESFFNLLSSLGFYLSYEVFNQKFGQSAPVLNNICGREKPKANIQTGCTKIMNQDKLNIWGLKLSDLSLIYFASNVILGLFISEVIFSIGLLAFFALLAVAYSVYFQMFIEKTFCKICLLIILILVCQTIISKFFFLNQPYYSSGFALVLIIFVIMTAFIINANLNFNMIKELKTSNIRNLRFKRDFEIFKRELLTKNPVYFSKNELFHLGKKNAKLHISIVSNPNCGFCKDDHILLEKINEKY
ncbi:vitamin K epoxide reductase family protein [Elizabethkingia meningoseptica]|uniref:vitamin K epoxide reductase family protein n=1 Tax=Elizabethkingia meningoseptica TaxID=238 RepID=UPI000B356EE1|nr:vitamin K epoxide reductase family protein [Elizabethkingia meningoseptica]